MMKYFQRVGKTFMLPISVLPVAAVLLGIGYWLAPASVAGVGSNNPIGVFLIQAGSALIGSIPILLAVGVAYGMSDDSDGSAAVSGLVAYLILTKVLSLTSVAAITGAEADPAFGSIANAFTGILCGLTASFAYNKFHKTVLPQAISFFSGKRFVPIVTGGMAVLISVVLFFAWPVAYSGLQGFGGAVSSLGPVGAGIYGFLNRLLIPTGLHNALNSVFWFDVIGINDIGNFWGGTGTLGVTGRYMAGFFPVMMFGLPGAALAMYQAAKPERKKLVKGLFIAGVFASFFTGTTEPLEFSFMFASPVLYVLHAALTGVSLFVCAQFKWLTGFAWSGGLMDFVLSFNQPLANKPYMLLVFGLVLGAVYYLLFKFFIAKFNLMTPGRENSDDEELSEELQINKLSKDSNFDEMARKIYEAMGGKNNVLSIDNCATRLRFMVKDSSAISESKIKAAGASGIIRNSKDSVQVIIGPLVEFVANAMKKINQ